MAKLKITRANGEVTEHKITPGVEYAFEISKGMGISKNNTAGFDYLHDSRAIGRARNTA